MNRFYTILILSFLTLYTIQASPKRELRGAWIATIKNVDWPTSSRLSVAEQKEELLDILNFYQRSGINAIFFQVRPASDAFYKSNLEPWSKFLTGTRGVSPKDEFDPLQFMLDEGHKRCIEVHAWINPFRALLRPTDNEMSEFLDGAKSRYWFIPYAKSLYFDPGMPAVRKYTLTVIADLLENYKVDGIHFDDYFYPYPEDKEVFDDNYSFNLYGVDKKREDWRRENVNEFVKMVSDFVAKEHPYVKFGISPFGVWANKSKTIANGSNTKAGTSSLNTLFADVKYWLDKGWIDYVAPQIYWEVGNYVADYKTLAEWWSKNSNYRHVYIGQAIYKFDSLSTIPAWQSGEEFEKQIAINRANSGIKGNILYNTSTLMRNPFNIATALAKDFNKNAAIVPEMVYKKQIEAEKPRSVRATIKDDHILLSWKRGSKKAFAFVVYASKGPGATNFDDSNNILKICNSQQTEVRITRSSFIDDEIYNYTISELSPTKNESKPSETMRIVVSNNKIVRKSIKNR